MSKISSAISAFDKRGSGIPELLAQYARDKPKRVLSLLALALALAGVAAVPPMIISRLVDGALQSAIDSRTIVLLALALATLACCESLLTLARRRLTIAGELEVREQGATERFRASIRLPMRAFGSGNEAALIRSFDDLDSVVEFVSARSIDLFADAALVFVYAALIVSVEPWLAVVFFALSSFATGSSILAGRHIQRAAENWLPVRDVRFGVIVECLTSMLTIKTLNAHHRVEIPFRLQQGIEQEALRNYRNSQAIADCVSRFWMVAIPGLGAAVGALLLMSGRLSAGNLVLFLSVSTGLVAALTAGHQTLLQLHEARASLARMQAITDDAPETFHDTECAGTIPLAGIMVRDVKYAHAAAGVPTLQNLSMSLRPGEHIAIVGRSGVGKTTLTHLLARLLEPSEGLIAVDGLASASLDAYRRNVVLAPHSVAVFGASLRENVRLWDPAVGDETIHEALGRAGLATLVAESESGLDMLLGARGNPLSAGQQQRLGLARVLLRRPNILILDEATSALDMETERAVLASLRDFMRGRVMIVVTHREAVAATFDRVLKMQNGRLLDAS